MKCIYGDYMFDKLKNVYNNITNLIFNDSKTKYFGNLRFCFNDYNTKFFDELKQHFPNLKSLHFGQNFNESVKPSKG